MMPDVFGWPSESRLLSLPGDATQAGPLDRPAPDPPPDWRDYCAYAREAIRDAVELYNDCDQRKKYMRNKEINCAITHLESAKAALNG